MWGPPVIGWFINPMNTIVIGTINHIVIGVMFTNLAIVNGGLTRGTYCCGVVLQLRSRERSHSSRCETFGAHSKALPLVSNRQAMRKGTDKDWEQRAGCMTFPEAVAKDGTWWEIVI